MSSRNLVKLTDIKKKKKEEKQTRNVTKTDKSSKLKYYQN